MDPPCSSDLHLLHLHLSFPVFQRHCPDQRASGRAGGGQEAEALSARGGKIGRPPEITKQDSVQTNLARSPLILQPPAVQLQQCTSRLQFLESSTVGRSIVSKQEARVCDLENKLEFQKGQVKRFEVSSGNHRPTSLSTQWPILGQSPFFFPIPQLSGPGAATARQCSPPG